MGRRHACGVSVTTSRFGAAVALAVAWSLHAAEGRAQDADGKRWAVGLELAWLGVPHGHLGLAPSLDTSAISPELVARYRLLNFAALDVGFGLPHSAMGLSGWAAFEVFATVAANQKRTLALELYQKSGLQLGYAGPDYFARHDNEFVGYGYAAAGPLAFALRFPVGINLRWAGGVLDNYTEVVPIVALTPTTEVLYTLASGIRVRF
jgi:hypothetical protein